MISIKDMLSASLVVFALNVLYIYSLFTSTNHWSTTEFDVELAATSPIRHALEFCALTRSSFARLRARVSRSYALECRALIVYVENNQDIPRAT